MLAEREFESRMLAFKHHNTLLVVTMILLNLPHTRTERQGLSKARKYMKVRDWEKNQYLMKPYMCLIQCRLLSLSQFI